MSVEKEKIINLFQLLNDNNIEYVLLRNINNELPENLSSNKDIDIMVRKDSKASFHSLMKENGWRRVQHPWDFGNNFVFLYAMDQLEFYNKNQMALDVCFQLCCRSVNNREWMPVDQIIQKSVWDNRRKNPKWGWYELCNEDLLIHILLRCIFDKGYFSDGYINTINELIKCVDINEVRIRAEVIFFKFTPILLECLKRHEYESLIKSYLTFIDY